MFCFLAFFIAVILISCNDLTNQNFNLMKTLVSVIILLNFANLLQAQNHRGPSNPKAGKCYQRCFDFYEKYDWKEVSCDTINKNRKKTAKDLLEIAQTKIKMLKYQEKLKQLGYNVDLTGIADTKTTTAHNRYLRKKEREKRRKERMLSKN